MGVLLISGCVHLAFDYFRIRLLRRPGSGRTRSRSKTSRRLHLESEREAQTVFSVYVRVSDSRASHQLHARYGIYTRACRCGRVSSCIHLSVFFKQNRTHSVVCPPSYALVSVRSPAPPTPHASASRPRWGPPRLLDYRLRIAPATPKQKVNFYYRLPRGCPELAPRAKGSRPRACTHPELRKAGGAR